MKSEKVTVRMSSADMYRLYTLCRLNECSMSEMVRDLIRNEFRNNQDVKECQPEERHTC